MSKDQRKSKSCVGIQVGRSNLWKNGLIRNVSINNFDNWPSYALVETYHRQKQTLFFKKLRVSTAFKQASQTEKCKQSARNVQFQSF